ncbi:uncharacterized protein LOC143012642 [Genypterus blacodes]|uniref:uncharacterized protein LOC143012642 n=1 Tax=Genypterus blacodes TaxID=154954 RepID=UPI003F777A79
MDAYFPVGVRKDKNEAKPEAKRKKVVRDKDKDQDPDQEAKARLQAQLEQRHLEAYWNMHRLRDALHQRYAALLKEKVRSQRLALQQRHERTRRESENHAKRKQRKLTFCKLQHDDSFLKHLPKTSYYLIFGLQKQLDQGGFLKTHHDLENFYQRINYNTQPSQLQRNLQDIRKKMLGSKSAAAVVTQDTGQQEEPPHSRSGSADVLLSGNRERDKVEQMFPKMKAPAFASLRSKFLRTSTLPQLVIPEIPEKSKKAEICLSQLRQMHQMSLTNMVFSQRLLDRERDSLCWQDERGVQDLVLCVLPDTDSKTCKESHTDHPPLCSPKQPRSVQNNRPASPQNNKNSARYQCFEAAGRDKTVTRCRTPDPLSMEDVYQQKHVEIIDLGLKLWSNYTANTDG